MSHEIGEYPKNLAKKKYLYNVFVTISPSG